MAYVRRRAQERGNNEKKTRRVPCKQEEKTKNKHETAELAVSVPIRYDARGLDDRSDRIAAPLQSLIKRVRKYLSFPWFVRPIGGSSDVSSVDPG